MSDEINFVTERGHKAIEKIRGMVKAMNKAAPENNQAPPVAYDREYFKTQRREKFGDVPESELALDYPEDAELKPEKYFTGKK